MHASLLPHCTLLDRSTEGCMQLPPPVLCLTLPVLGNAQGDALGIALACRAHVTAVAMCMPHSSNACRSYAHQTCKRLHPQT